MKAFNRCLCCTITTSRSCGKGRTSAHVRWAQGKTVAVRQRSPVTMSRYSACAPCKNPNHSFLTPQGTAHAIFPVQPLVCVCLLYRSSSIMRHVSHSSYFDRHFSHEHVRRELIAVTNYRLNLKDPTHLLLLLLPLEVCQFIY